MLAVSPATLASANCLLVRPTELPQPAAYPTDIASVPKTPAGCQGEEFVSSFQRHCLLALDLRGRRGEGALGGIFIRTQVSPRRAPLS